MSLRICSEDQGPARLISQLGNASSDGPETELREKPPSSWVDVLLSCGQIQPAACFCMALELRMVFTAKGCNNSSDAREHYL